MSDDSLNLQQRRFVEEYLVDLNATQAALRANYSENSARQQGSQLLSNPYIQDAIQEAMEKRTKRTQVTQDEVILELKRIGFSRMKDFARWGASGVTFKESEEVNDDDACCISEITEQTNQHGGSLKIKLYDKVRALELLAKHLGMLKESSAGTGPEDPPESYQRPESMRTD